MCSNNLIVLNVRPAPVISSSRRVAAAPVLILDAFQTQLHAKCQNCVCMHCCVAIGNGNNSTIARNMPKYLDNSKRLKFRWIFTFSGLFSRLRSPKMEFCLLTDVNFSADAVPRGTETVWGDGQRPNESEKEGGGRSCRAWNGAAAQCVAVSCDRVDSN